MEQPLITTYFLACLSDSAFETFNGLSFTVRILILEHIVPALTPSITARAFNEWDATLKDKT